MYQVPASRSSVVQFVMTCPGMSHSSTFTLHMRDNGKVDDGKVWGDLCREKRVNIAYNTELPYGFEVNEETGEMVPRPLKPVTGVQPFISREWEILDSFFRPHRIAPNWTNCHGAYGWYDEEEGKWTGMVGKVSCKGFQLYFENVYLMYNLFVQVESDKADLAAGGGALACSYGRSRVSLCLPGYQYQNTYWFTR